MSAILKGITLPLAVAFLTACGGGEAEQQAEGSTPAEQASSDAEMAADEPEEPQEQQQAELPEGVTMEMVNQGKEIYAGAGLCYACHGGDGAGMPGLGANVTDDEWLHGDGSFESLVASVTDGVPAEKSSSGTPMPPRGGGSITDDQVQAVAAYVWTLSHGGSM